VTWQLRPAPAELVLYSCRHTSRGDAGGEPLALRVSLQRRQRVPIGRHGGTIGSAALEHLQDVGADATGTPIPVVGRGRWLPTRPALACPVCRTKMRARAITGVLNDRPCDARCEGALSAACRCACGGANHGRAWDATEREFRDVTTGPAAEPGLAGAP
jgi:hypothetical protein